MRNLRQFRVLLLAFHFCAGVWLQAQQTPGEPIQRQNALDLFSQGKRIEALPLLEDSVKANPKDDESLVALAASLVDHAATLSDQAAAGKERLRARDLLDQAWNLGNNSPLAMNLRDFLYHLPSSGAIEFSGNPKVEQLMRAGEAAFAQRDYPEALKNYAKALELEPTNYSAALFTANSYDRQNDYAQAATWYKRAIQLDPNIETAYRYDADMLARQSDLAAARTMLIQAAVAEPYNRAVWRELRAWATLCHTQINMVFVGIPASQSGKSFLGDSARPDPQISVAWDAYRATRKRWQNGGEFARHFPDEKEYRHTLAEETEALTAAAAKVAALHGGKETAALVAEDPAASQLLKLSDAGLIEPYVLFSLGDTGIGHDYAAYRDKNRDKLTEYMDQFVVPQIH